VQLPPQVRRIINERADDIGFASLKRAASSMSDAYRGGRAPRLSSKEDVAAYLVTRMPATYAAAHAVLSELRQRLVGTPIDSVLDVGAGSGGASLASREFFPAARITMVERSVALSDAARMWLPDAAVRTLDLPAALSPHSLVIAAYSLGEIPHPMIAALWQAARVALVVIEPGTPAGFRFIRAARDELLKSDAHMLAPCPHGAACPMVDPDWCHFGARVERSSMHRRIKDADLGYEDEKFSYVAVARDAVPLPAARILARPQHRPGLITIKACAREGLREEAIGRRDRARFRAARQIRWGEAWDEG
jgi:ribosomal protein RSM22 (predicted rRNA methylase)